MFGKNSRYRNVPESNPVDARGERPRGKELRVIPRLAGRFLYTVHDSDRLDLLAFKYYGDPTKWWQICDANPEQPYPTDLLDTRPVVAERVLLAHPKFEERFDQLIVALQDFAEVKTPDPGDEENPSRRDLVRSVLAVKYDTSLATRAQLRAAIADNKLRPLDTRGWTAGAKTVEVVAFDDPAAKLAWTSMTRALAETPGVVRVESGVMESALGLAYNRSVVERARLVSVIEAHGFEEAPGSEKFSRVGARIVVPPNQTA